MVAKQEAKRREGPDLIFSSNSLSQEITQDRSEDNDINPFQGCAFNYPILPLEFCYLLKIPLLPITTTLGPGSQHMNPCGDTLKATAVESPQKSIKHFCAVDYINKENQ
jgi:hypothetical protein